jgi:hypothetical protein
MKVFECKETASFFMLQYYKLWTVKVLKETVVYLMTLSRKVCGRTDEKYEKKTDAFPPKIQTRHLPNTSH